MRRLLVIFCSALMLTGILTGPAWAQSDCAADQAALNWLERMSRSLREVSYQGVFTYQHGNSMQSLRISHSVSGEHETEQITSLNGRGGSVTRTEHPLDCIHPGSKLVRISSAFTEDCGLAQSYSLQLGGQALVAGREVQLLRILPRDMYRYGYQMALDVETGLLLRSQTLAQDGKVLEHFQFADLQIGDVTQSGTTVEVLHEASHGEIEPQAATGFSRAGGHWKVEWVPQGFMHTQAGADQQLDKTYTDGLAVFSVYMERLERDIEPGEGRARRGGTTAYTRGMHLQGQPVLVTVVGEVPISTARMVADSVNFLVVADAH
jgi:sigma-E factor negative regulatory protein RseB